MGRIARSWELLTQSFAVLRSDKELVFLPIFSAMFNIAASVLILGTAALFFRPELQFLWATRTSRPAMPQPFWGVLFVLYLVNYFIAIFFNVVLVSVASDRLAGGHATMNDGLQIAWQRKGRILQWAFLAATVGILLRALEERLGRLGRIVAGFIGIAWSLATYFVAPILAAENVGPVEALQRSAGIFTETWGEELSGGFSFGLIFFLLSIPGAFLMFAGVQQGGAAAIAGVATAILYWLVLSVISSAVQGIFVAALYRYATTKQVPPGFSSDAFRNAWQPKRQ